MSTKPGVGRFVTYNDEDGKPHPALVVASFTGGTYLNLVVFLDGSNDSKLGGSNDKLQTWKTSIAEGEDTTKPNTWHWPKRDEVKVEA